MEKQFFIKKLNYINFITNNSKKYMSDINFKQQVDTIINSVTDVYLVGYVLEDKKHYTIDENIMKKLLMMKK